MTADATYSKPEIEQRLSRDLPHWRLEEGCIRRTFKTGGWKGTLMAVNTVGHLAEAAWHHPDIAASYALLTVSLRTHSVDGITDKDFELAAKIEEVVQWRPAAGSALEGTPEDPKFRYLVYD